MPAQDRTQLERYVSLASEGLAELERWVAANAGSPLAPQVQALIDDTKQNVDALKVITQRLLKAELVERRDRLNTQIGNLP